MVTKQSIRRPNPTLPDSVFKMFSMQGKVVIITGGTGGIGYEVARGLAEAGANVALWYHKSSQGEQLAASLENEFGVKAKAYKCSVQNFDEVGFPIQSQRCHQIPDSCVSCRFKLLLTLWCATSAGWT